MAPSDGPPDKPAGDYRKQAALSRAMAAHATDEAERQEWLKLAAHWDALADLLDQLGPPPGRR
jgi:hypothetical protein